MFPHMGILSTGIVRLQLTVANKAIRPIYSVSD